MLYFKETQNDTVELLMETLEMETKKNLDWTLQELFSLCREISFIDDDPHNADYSDETYLILAELFAEFSQYGQMVNGPQSLRGVRSFTMDAAAKQEMLGALTALQSGTIDGRTRELTAEWEKSGTLQAWQSHLRDLIQCIEETVPQQSDQMPEKSAAKKPEEKKRAAGVVGLFVILAALLFILLWVLR